MSYEDDPQFMWGFIWAWWIKGSVKIDQNELRLKIPTRCWELDDLTLSEN